MTQRQESRCCGMKLRPLCFIIGYMHLVSSIADVVCHLLTVAIVTNGFQCDVNNDSLRAISLPWLEPILLILNLGTHGFYPYPRVFRNQYQIYVDQMSVSTEPKCYPGMLHVNLIDILNLLINVIWLKIVIAYVGGVHKKNSEPMRMFVTMSVVKLAMQAMYFGYQPFFYEVFTVETLWFLKITDILIALICIVIVHKYSKALRLQKTATQQTVEKPPSYVECLITENANPPKYESKEELVIVDEKKIPVENDQKV